MGTRAPLGDAVLDAAVALIAEGGLEGTSVRLVAARAGASIGAVQHHFPTKDALLAAAMLHVEAVHRERFAREHAGEEPAAVLRAAVRALVPSTGGEDRQAAAVWLAFVARAAVHEPTAARHREVWARAEDDLAHLVARALGQPARASGVRSAAGTLLALADGLAVAVLLEPGRMPAVRARRLVDAAVAAVLGPSA